MKMVPLGEIVRKSGSRAKEDSGYPVYSVTKHDGFVPSEQYFKKQVFSKDRSTYTRVKAGEFAYATIHLDEGSIGIAPTDCLISPMYTVFAIDQNAADPNYLIRLLKSPPAIAQYDRLGNGSVHRRRSIPLSALGQLNVPLPPLDEQRRIATILDKADAIRQKRRQAIAHLDTLTQSIFQDMFGSTQKWATIDELSESTQYGTSTKAGRNGEWPVLRMGNITYSGQLDLSDLKYLDLEAKEIPKYTVQKGDLLFNRTNSAELVGKTCVVNTDRPLAFAGYLVRARFNRPETALVTAGYLNSPHGKATLRNMAKAIVGQANINATELRSIRVPAATESKETEYADRIVAVESHANIFRRATTNDDALFASLQAQAFRGEL